MKFGQELILGFVAYVMKVNKEIVLYTTVIAIIKYAYLATIKKNLKIKVKKYITVSYYN